MVAALINRTNLLQIGLIFFGGLFIFVFGLATYQIWLNHRFSVGPVEHLTAIVRQTNGVQIQTRSGNNNFNFVDYTYAYDGAFYLTHKQVLPETRASTHIGDGIPILILKDDPTVSRIDVPLENTNAEDIPRKHVIAAATLAGLIMLLAVYSRFSRHSDRHTRRPRAVPS